MKTNVFKRWLVKRGAIFCLYKGRHLKVYLNAKQSVFPAHSSVELGTRLIDAIKKQLSIGK